MTALLLAIARWQSNGTEGVPEPTTRATTPRVTAQEGTTPEVPTPQATTPGVTLQSTAPADAISVEPGTDIQPLVDANPEGTFFLLKSGRHSNQKVIPKSGNTFVGEQGAVMDGESVVDAAFSSGGQNVTIQNLIIENYSTPPQRGAVEGPAVGWRIIGNEIRFNGGAGINVGYESTGSVHISGNYVHHNEQIGVVIHHSVGATVIDNEIAHNNSSDRYDMDWEAGGTKFMSTTNLHVANNQVHSNHGAGLWTDADNFNTVFENNTIVGNYGPGILHEISYDAVIRNNTVTGNAHRFYFGGILVSSSSNVEVYENTLSENNGGVIGLQDDRGAGNRGLWQTTGLNVHSNVVSWDTGFHGVQVNSGPDILTTDSISFDNNTYTSSQSRPFRWGTAGSSENWQRWRNQGHDTHSTMR